MRWLYETFTEQRGDATYLVTPWWLWVAYCVPPALAVMWLAYVVVSTARQEGISGFACLTEPELALAGLGGLCLLPVWPVVVAFWVYEWAADRLVR